MKGVGERRLHRPVGSQTVHPAAFDAVFSRGTFQGTGVLGREPNGGTLDDRDTPRVTEGLILRLLFPRTGLVF